MTREYKEVDSKGVETGRSWRWGDLPFKTRDPKFSFHASEHRDHHVRLLRRRGYQLVGDEPFAFVQTDLYDNQLWFARDLNHNGERVALKVSSIVYFKRHTMSAAVGALLNEARILWQLHEYPHDNIVYVKWIFGISDPTVGFPYSFHA